MDPAADRQRFTQREAENNEADDRHRQERRAVPAGEHLQCEETNGEAQVALPSAVQIRVQKCQRERNPLDRGEVQLSEAQEARRRISENESGEHRRWSQGAQTTCQ